MGVSFSAQIKHNDFPVRKIYAKDRYDFSQQECEEYFAGDPYMLKEQGTNLYYMEEPAIDFVYFIDMSCDNFSSILRKIDSNIYLLSKSEGHCGQVSFENLNNLRSKIMKALNTENTVGVRDSYQEGNWIHCGLDQESINKRLSTMLEIIVNAQKHNVGVSWG
jgi:hypothetical protein